MSAPLACKKDWVVVGLWSTNIVSKSILRRIEDEVRNCFVDACGGFEIFGKLKSDMQKVHQNLNGLTEIVRIDLAKIDACVSFPSQRAWEYQQSSGLVESVLSVIRIMDFEWRKAIEFDEAK